MAPWTEQQDDPNRRVRRGRGAVSNRDGRFEHHAHALEDDGWSSLDEVLAADRVATLVGEEATREIIARNDSPDVPFDQSINPYRGCEHGCIYCFARPSHAYLGLSPGLDFETRLYAKSDAAARLERALRRKGYKVSPLAIGANTDPYQPIEKERRITRALIGVMDRFNHPFGIITKSDRVCRDIDLLAPMAARGLVQVALSITTLDAGLARVMEPRAATPARRIEAVRRLSAAGIPVSVLVSPIIPAINDHEIEAVLEAAATAGAGSASTILLRLPLEIADLFREWLETHFPDRAERVLSLIRQSRGDRLYDPRFGHRMKGSGPYAEMLRARFERAKRRLGLDQRRLALDTSQFAVPLETCGDGRQGELFAP
ncbi:MAG: PA0069 family radical SAM protein [Azospirillaceae bacterium]